MNTLLVDDKGRTILAIGDNGRLAIARYPDLSKEYKDYVVDCFRQLTDGDWQKLERFLNFEEDDSEFCS